jgi:1,4-alpha-glucan branching enzyme
VSPLGGLAVAGLMAAVLALTVVQSRSGADSVQPAGRSPAPALVATTPPVQTVQFILAAPRAGRVALVGDFNDWDTEATQLQRSTGDLWTVTIPLTAGRYTYTFVVDGKRWVADPSAVPAPADDFGRPSSVITVARAGS